MIITDNSVDVNDYMDIITGDAILYSYDQSLKVYLN